jgi:hypothetical protein
MPPVAPATDRATDSPERFVGGQTGYSSPPCFMHELSPAWFGDSSVEEESRTPEPNELRDVELSTSVRG